MEWWPYISNLNPVVMLLFTGAGVILAYQAYAVRRRRHHLDSLLKLAERLESNQNRERRQLLYGKLRGSHADWTSADREHIHGWLGELDLAAIVAAQRDLDVKLFFSLYGDVFVRSIWLLAPYIDEQRQMRGRQFGLPLASFYPIVVRLWENALRNGYPEEIGLAGNQGRISLREFRSDNACGKLVRDGHAIYGLRAHLKRRLFKLI